MTVDQVQNFLNSKVPACDTWGTQPSEYGGGTRAQYGTSVGYPPPYICLKDYYENPTTHANNLNGNPIPSGALSAAQIIVNAAQTYGISARALLATLQKESSGPLVTDTWPFSYQYTNAMGYGCPDSAPCDPTYAGFYNQVTNAARQFSLYKSNPTSYRHIPLQNNDVLYSPSSSCGSSSVYIQNYATAGLYNYTPYQPNQAALNNLYGSGDSCSSYGNRNFWVYFNQWFGSSQNYTAYAWNLNTLKYYSDSARQNQIPANSLLTMAPGQTVYARLIAYNQGYGTWDGNTKIAVANPYDRHSVFQNASWLAYNRLAAMTETQTTAGNMGTFDFSLTAPTSTGRYSEGFTLVDDGVSSFAGTFNIPIDVVQPLPAPPSQTTVSFLSSGQYTLSPEGHFALVLTPDGNLVLTVNFVPVWSSGTAGSGATYFQNQADGNLVLYTAQNKPVWASNTNGQSQGTLTLQTDGNLVLYGSSGVMWSTGTNTSPDELSQVNETLSAGLVMRPGQKLETPSRNHYLILQDDGNLVLYTAQNKPIWASNTNGKHAAYLVMQNDGNLVLYDASNHPLWASNTNIGNPSHLFIQEDGNLVVYRDGNSQPTWATNTNGK